jgi:predicted secreted protein
MAATKASGGFGTLLKIGDGEVSETFSTIAEVYEINPPATSLGTADATHMESPAGYMEKIATLLETSAVEVDLNFVGGDSSHALLRTDHAAKTLRNFEIHTPDGAYKWEFAAFVTNIGQTTPKDDRMSTPVTLTPSGPVTHGATA